MRWMMISLVLLAVSAHADEIYRTVDENGNVVFTDKPSPEQRKSAQPVEVQPPNTFNTEEATVSSGGLRSQSNDDGGTGHVLLITAPENDATVRANNGNVDVVAKVSPAPKRGQQLVLLMDGTPVGVQPEGDTWHLQNIDRGAHVLTLHLVDPNTGEALAQSAPSTFYLQRASVARPGG